MSKISPKALRHIAMLSVLLGAPAILGAAANAWTGGRPNGAAETDRAIVAADPGNPDALYGAFGNLLYRSSDGGRTWSHLPSFGYISAVLVHPAAPSTIYVASGTGSVDGGLFKSTDAGETWSRTLAGKYVTALAGSPTDASTVFASSFGRIYKTTNAGATWSSVDYGDAVASLVISPSDPTTSYAGAYAFEYWYYLPGSLGKTTDGGASWHKISPEIDSVVAVAVDAVASSTVYVATGQPIGICCGGSASGVLRSEDAGLSWTWAGAGLPGGSVQSLAVDPLVSGTLYAGTEAGVYRSRDGGRSWTPFGQWLTGAPIFSLAIDGTGRRLHAGTPTGVYDLEIAHGPVDVAEGPAGESRILLRDGDRFALGTLDVSGHWTSSAPGDASATWTAIAVATAGSDRTHVLWQCGDGRTALEIIGPLGRQSAAVFEKRSGWIASDLSVRTDGQINVLWTGTDGRMFVAMVNASGAVTEGQEYGPATGWSAIAIADGPGSETWVLWRSTDGRAALSAHRDGTMVSSYKYAAHLDWTAEDVAVAADGRPRLLRTSPEGLASVATIDTAGRLMTGQRYGLPGFTPRRIAAGSDGSTRLLFGSEDEQGELLLLNGDNTLSSRHALHP